MSDGDFTSPTNITWQGHTGLVEYGGGDKGMIARFYNRPMPNPAKSKELGRPYFEDKIYVIVHPPGERLNIVDREATGQDTRRWPMQWQQFQQNKQQQPDGTPIDLLYPEQPAVAATLRANGVSTIELCSELSAQAIDNIGMGCQRYVNDAKKFLEASAKGVKASQMRIELEERDREIRTLKSMVESLKSRVEELTSGAQGVPDLASLQALLAASMGRPTHMPNKAFDPQSAMINATSATAQLTQQANATKTKRHQRVRISD
jgi:hypothetical protein